MVSMLFPALALKFLGIAPTNRSYLKNNKVNILEGTPKSV